MTVTAPLSARAYALHPDVDLLDYYEPRTGFFFEHHRTGVVGVGTAIRVSVPPGPDHVARAAAAARDVLANIERGPGPAPLVVGALPFDGSQDAELVVPMLSVVRRGTDAWLIEVGRDGTPLPETMPHEPPPEPWDTLRVRSERDPDTYVRAVIDARARIAVGALRKVVLARTVLAESDHPFDVPSLLERLRRIEPDAYVFGVRGFLGATPELLVSRSGTRLRSNPLAGTIPRGTDDAASREALLSSAKDLEEHGFVADAVRTALAPVCADLTVTGPDAIATSQVWHLATEVRGTLHDPAPDALTLAARLHPTPAVCGVPRDAALDAIKAFEPQPRGLYAGTVGWVDADGDGEWAVALRCAEIDGPRARLFGGAGIVAASDPASELAETDAKMRALLDALRYG